MKLDECTRCKGIGKVACGCCNCGSGEGCTLHSETAIGLWGDTCPSCNGSGKNGIRGVHGKIQNGNARPDDSGN